MRKIMFSLVFASFIGSAFAGRIHYLQETKYDDDVEFGLEGTSSGTIKFRNKASNNSVIIKADVITSTYTLNLPPNDGTSGQVLKTDGSGNMEFGDIGDAQIPDTITRDAEWDTIGEIETAISQNIIVSSENAVLNNIQANEYISVKQDKKILLDGVGGDTYIMEESATGNVKFFKGGVEYMRFE